MAGIIFSESSGLNDSVFGKSQAPIKAMISQNIEAFEETSLIDKVFYMDTTENYAEKYTTETAAGDFEDVGENGAYPKTSIQEGYSKIIEPTTWKSSFEVTQEMMEDAKLGKIKSRANIFGTSYNRTREKFAAAMLYGGMKATTTIGSKKYDTTTADGAPLFSASHTSITKGYGKQSNSFMYGDGVSVLDALDRAQECMQDFRDDNGNLLNIAPNTIIMPNNATLKREIFAAIGSDFDPNTANNAVNFQMGLWNVMIWNYLPKVIEGCPYFYMLDSQYNEDYMCMPWLDRVKLTVSSAIDPNTDANVWKGRARFGAGFQNWRSISFVGQYMGETPL